MGHDHSRDLSYLLPPYDHQRNAINQTVDRLKQHGGAALFVDMGLGKSAIAIHVARILRPSRILIVCPKGIVPVWKAELRKHIANLPPIIVWDAQKSTTKKWASEFRKTVSQPLAIGIMNVEAFQTDNTRVKRFVTEFSGGLCIVDESTSIKNPKALRTKKILASSGAFDYRIIMTGTEITNTILDLYAQFAFIVPGLWGINYYAFRARYAVLKEIPVAGGRTVKIVVGFRKVDELLNRVKPYVFRARKEDCFDLPEKIYATIPVEMNREQKEAYASLKKDMIAEYHGTQITVTQALTLLLRFHQVTGGFFPESHEPLGKSNPKIDALLTDLDDTNEKAIVWCTYKAEIAGVVAALEKAYGKESVVRYTGDESTAEREQAIESFRGDARFFVANPQVAGYGLNLQFCTLQYFYSRNRRMDMNKQAEDRSHRIGTQGACVYKTLLVPHTIDQTIHESIMKKQTLLEGIQTMDFAKIHEIIG